MNKIQKIVKAIINVSILSKDKEHDIQRILSMHEGKTVYPCKGKTFIDCIMYIPETKKITIWYNVCSKIERNNKFTFTTKAISSIL